MIKLILLAALSLCTTLPVSKVNLRIFDVHIHGTRDISHQIKALQKAGVYKAAISTSWEQQHQYKDQQGISFLYGLMLPCPNGKVPYSLQPCYSDGGDWPGLEWTEKQIREGKVNFLGEILSQYYGISSSDTLLFPYYALAEKYNIPVGIHTGGAGPDHGSPNFKMELGSPTYLERCLLAFPKLKVWLMHGGDQFYEEAISMLSKHKNVFADISVISNPDIVSSKRFKQIMSDFIDAGLEDQLMFGTDNGDIEKVVASIEELPFLSAQQKTRIYYSNAEQFFAR
ncbi:MAG: hypothetical protein EOO04_23370 [Chitinophagaceae bacterium]|nr:MAG: hypothetical protein EOO04_23370 [Chitinophagaceae bacterium]